MSFSKILSRFDKRDTGRLFVKSNLESLSWIAINLAVLKRVRKVPVVKEKLNKSARCSETSFLSVFKTLLGILYGPVDFLISRRRE